MARDNMHTHQKVTIIDTPEIKLNHDAIELKKYVWFNT